MRVIVCGTRTFGAHAWHKIQLEDALGEVDKRGLIVVTGGCKGADMMAQDWARAHRLRVETHRVLDSEWKELGKAAGPLRNRKMAQLGADLCVAFWDGNSSGTKDMIEQARAHKIKVSIFFHGAGSAKERTLPLFR